MSPETKKLLRNIHRWGGLVLTIFVIFYCFTGILLNHRKDFDYFIIKKRSESTVPVSDIKRLRKFIDFYKAQINRKDDPTVIKIKNGKIIEFLYGSHGKTTFIIDPLKGRMEKIEKIPAQPWAWLNRLHKAFKTADIWIFVTDAVSVILILVTITGLFIFRYRKLDYTLIVLGLVIFVLAAIMA